MSLVSNTGPLVALAKADMLALLKALFGDVHIAPAVHRELLAKSGPEARLLDAALADFIHVTPVASALADAERATSHLGAGEQHAILLALDRSTPLLIDDRSGRSCARRLGIKVTGTVGVLVQAKRGGHIQQVAPVLEQIRQAGYYLSDSLLEVAARLAGE